MTDITFHQSDQWIKEKIGLKANNICDLHGSLKNVSLLN